MPDRKMTVLPDDFVRCNPKKCELKNNCLRHLTPPLNRADFVADFSQYEDGEHCEEIIIKIP